MEPFSRFMAVLGLINLPVAAFTSYMQWQGQHGEAWGLTAMTVGYVMFCIDWVVKDWL